MREERIERILKLVDEIWQGNKDKNLMKSVVTTILLSVETYYFNRIEYDLIALKKSLNEDDFPNPNTEGEINEAKSSD
jgi:hypothetical protein